MWRFFQLCPIFLGEQYHVGTEWVRGARIREEEGQHRLDLHLSAATARSVSRLTELFWPGRGGLTIPGGTVPVKRHRGEPGHTRDTRAYAGHGSHRRTSQPSKHNDRTTTRRPKPRPTQQPTIPVKRHRGSRNCLNWQAMTRGDVRCERTIFGPQLVWCDAWRPRR